MQGYALGRNSSRVLNPPGGKCSDIFGSGPEPPAKAPTRTAPTAPQAPAPATAAPREEVQAKRNESTVFRSPLIHRTNEGTAAASYRRNQSTVFAAGTPRGRSGGVPWATEEPAPRMEAPRMEAAVAPAARAVDPAPAAAPMATGHREESIDRVQAVNPASRGSSTGDVLMQGHCGRNSSRVSQPPGGRSSISFF